MQRGHWTESCRRRHIRDTAVVAPGQNSVSTSRGFAGPTVQSLYCMLDIVHCILYT